MWLAKSALLYFTFKLLASESPQNSGDIRGEVTIIHLPKFPRNLEHSSFKAKVSASGDRHPASDYNLSIPDLQPPVCHAGEVAVVGDHYKGLAEVFAQLKK